MPLSGVFYPVDTLPQVLRPIAVALPTTHAFSAMRTVLDGDALPWSEIGIAALSAAVLSVAALVFVARMLALFRRRGYISRYS
jgi:ABC-2 type transport system permease protein